MGDRRNSPGAPGSRSSAQTNSQSSPANRLAQLSRRVSQVPRTPRSVGNTTSKMRQPQFGSNRQLPCSTNPPVDIISAIEAARRCMRDLKKALINLSKIEESRQCSRFGAPLTFGHDGDDDPMAVSTPQETMVSPARQSVAADPSPSIRGVSSHRVAQNQFSDGAPLNTEAHSATSGSSVASTPRQHSRPSETDVEPIRPIHGKHSSSAKEVPRRVAQNQLSDGSPWNNNYNSSARSQHRQKIAPPARPFVAAGPSLSNRGEHSSAKKPSPAFTVYQDPPEEQEYERICTMRRYNYKAPNSWGPDQLTDAEQIRKKHEEYDWTPPKVGLLPRKLGIGPIIQPKNNRR